VLRVADRPGQPLKAGLCQAELERRDDDFAIVIGHQRHGGGLADVYRYD
jgi:hypothetical protein